MFKYVRVKAYYYYFAHVFRNFTTQLVCKLICRTLTITVFFNTLLIFCTLVILLELQLRQVDMSAKSWRSNLPLYYSGRIYLYITQVHAAWCSVLDLTYHIQQMCTYTVVSYLRQIPLICIISPSTQIFRLLRWSFGGINAQVLKKLENSIRSGKFDTHFLIPESFPGAS